MPAKGNRHSHGLLAYDFEQIVRRGPPRVSHFGWQVICWLFQRAMLDFR